MSYQLFACMCVPQARVPVAIGVFLPLAAVLLENLHLLFGPSPLILTPGQLEAFDRDGFIVLHEAVPPAMVHLPPIMSHTSPSLAGQRTDAAMARTPPPAASAPRVAYVQASTAAVPPLVRDVLAANRTLATRCEEMERKVHDLEERLRKQSVGGVMRLTRSPSRHHP